MAICPKMHSFPFTSRLLALWVTLTLFLSLSPCVHAAQAAQIVDFEGCLVRFQTPRPGQSASDARITNLNWPTTTSDVTRTINDYFNFNGQNVQLFLNGGMSALNYANYIQALCMTHQDGLNLDNTQISVLLPSGVAKVSKVYPNAGELGGNGGVTGIFGIRTNQALSPSDWGYTTGSLMKQAVASWSAQYSRYGGTQAGVNLIRGDGAPVIMVMTLVGA